MASLLYTFDSYRCVHYSSSPEGRTDVIVCYKGNEIAGHAFFYGNDARLPTDYIEGGKYIRLHFHQRRFQDIIRTIRVEEPVIIGLNEETGYGAIGTFTELVGEEEG